MFAAVPACITGDSKRRRGAGTRCGGSESPAEPHGADRWPSPQSRTLRHGFRHVHASGGLLPSTLLRHAGCTSGQRNCSDTTLFHTSESEAPRVAFQLSDAGQSAAAAEQRQFRKLAALRGFRNITHPAHCEGCEHPNLRILNFLIKTLGEDERYPGISSIHSNSTPTSSQPISSLQIPPVFARE